MYFIFMLLLFEQLFMFMSIHVALFFVIRKSVKFNQFDYKYICVDMMLSAVSDVIWCLSKLFATYMYARQENTFIEN